jgi:hypothetical protein
MAVQQPLRLCSASPDFQVCLPYRGLFVWREGVAFVGIASKEEGLAGREGYECCTFRGAVVALDVSTRQILWKTYMVPSQVSRARCSGSAKRAAAIRARSANS